MTSDEPFARLRAASLAEAVIGRTSVRRFRPDPVPADDVRAMVGLAVRAANGRNLQLWRFVAVQDAGLRGAMREAVYATLDDMAAWPELAEAARSSRRLRAYATFFADAPLVMAVFSLPYSSPGDELLSARPADAERDRLRRGPTCRASARPYSSCARRRTPWATARAG